MPNVCARYVLLLNEEGLPDLQSYRIDHLKLRLKQYFGEQLVFFRSKKRVTAPELVTAKSIPQQILLQHAAKMIHRTLKTNDDLEIVDIKPDDQPQVDISKVVEDAAVVELFNSALYLRNQILALRSSIPPTPTSEDLLEDGATVPPVLYNFLAWLFCGAAATADGDITLEAKVSPHYVYCTEPCPHHIPGPSSNAQAFYVATYCSALDSKYSTGHHS